MTINDTGLALIKDFEGCRLKAYRDIKGILTIGVGHTGGVAEGQEITQEEADDLLRSDLERFEKGVSSLVQSSLTDNQFSALACLAFNIGLGNLASSTLLKQVNKSQYFQAADSFLAWDHANGVVIPGLLRRRRAERDLFLTA